MTLAEWKRKLQPGQKLTCTYRWYWGKDKAAPEGSREEIEVMEVKTTQLVYKTQKDPRVWMQFPKATELKADEKGFELYFPVGEKWGPRSGVLMSRYEYA